MRRSNEFACTIFLLSVAVRLRQHRSVAQKRDPLNEKEVDEMRESADWPDKRLELMVKFARARMTAIDQLRANGKTAKDRPMQIHDLLEDFTTLVDEIRRQHRHVRLAQSRHAQGPDSAGGGQ